MPDLVRIQDNDTGGRASVGREYADLLVEQGSARILPNVDAADPIFGMPLPAEPGHETGRYDDLKADELRTELASRDLPTTGTKPDLVERLSQNDAEKGDNR